MFEPQIKLLLISTFLDQLGTYILITLSQYRRIPIIWKKFNPNISGFLKHVEAHHNNLKVFFHSHILAYQHFLVLLELLIQTSKTI